MRKGLRLEDLEVYKVSMEIGDMVWEMVIQWDYFAKKTLGAQFVDAADSIALNIAEGYGRFHFKENKNFCYYSRGSAKETLSAANKAKNRQLVSETHFEALNNKLEKYFRLVHGYIQSIGNYNHTEGSGM
jgi:four helix bundle protein